MRELSNSNPFNPTSPPLKRNINAIKNIILLNKTNIISVAFILYFKENMAYFDNNTLNFEDEEEVQE